MNAQEMLEEMGWVLMNNDCNKVIYYHRAYNETLGFDKKTENIMWGIALV